MGDNIHAFAQIKPVGVIPMDAGVEMHLLAVGSLGVPNDPIEQHRAVPPRPLARLGHEIVHVEVPAPRQRFRHAKPDHGMDGQTHRQICEAIPLLLLTIRLFDETLCVEMRPETLCGADIQLGIAEGVGGKVLFYLALHEATRDPAYLADAAGGADYMIAIFPQQLGEPNVLPIATSMYTGVAGVGFILNVMFARTGYQWYRDGALRAVQLLHDGATAAVRDGAITTTY